MADYDTFVAGDFAKETTTTTGTNHLTLDGAVTGFRRVSDVCPQGGFVPYTISDGTNFESGLGSYNPGGFIFAKFVGNSVLSADINDSVTSITLRQLNANLLGTFDGTIDDAYPTSGTITLGSEQITYTGITTNTLTGCTRGANSTSAAAHTAGTEAKLTVGTFQGTLQVVESISDCLYPSSGTLIIDQELISYTGITQASGGSLTTFSGLTRGVSNTNVRQHQEFVQVRVATGTSMVLANGNPAHFLERSGTRVSESSNSNGLVNFGSGTKTVTIGQPGNASVTMPVQGRPNIDFASAENVALGEGALSSLNVDLTTGGLGLLPQGNIGLGKFAAKSITTGMGNCIIGNRAGEDITSAINNILIGHRAGINISTGNENIVIGGDENITEEPGTTTNPAAKTLATGSKNILMGTSVSALLTGDENIIIGHRAGIAATSADNNIIIGTSASAASLTTGDNNIVIGPLDVLGGGAAAKEVMIGPAANEFTMFKDSRNNFGFATIERPDHANFISGASNNILIGINAGKNMRDADGNIVIGALKLSGGDRSNSNRVFIGTMDGNAADPDGTQLLEMRVDRFECSSIDNSSSGTGTNLIIDSSGNVKKESSSLRYKQDVQDLEGYGLEAVMQLRPVTYRDILDPQLDEYDEPNDTETRHLGFIAEELDELGLKAAVIYDKQGLPDGIHYHKLTAMLVKAIQELTAQVKELKK